MSEHSVTPAREEGRGVRRAMAAAVLSLQAIVLGLSTPVMISIASVSTRTALAVGLGTALAAIVLAGALRSEWGYRLGYVLQVVAIALGFVVTAMFVLGAIFAALWVTADLMGRRIEQEKVAAWAEFRAQNPD